MKMQKNQGGQNVHSVSRKAGVFPEYIGDIVTEALLQNLTNSNRYDSSIDFVRESVPQGFTVKAYFKKKIYEDDDELLADFGAQFKPNDPKTWELKGKLIRIVLEPKKP